MRSLLLGAAASPGIRRFVTAHGPRLGASRFVAGVTLDDLMEAVRATNAQGFHVAAGLLGEDVRDAADAAAAAAGYREILERFAADRADGNVALKLTHLGLAMGEATAYGNLTSVARCAKALGNTVRLDMEQSSLVDTTLAIYKRARADGFDNVGTVLQAYLYRSEADLASLLPMRPNLRLVKGAYLEPRSIAYPAKRDVDAAFVRLIEASLRGGGFTAIATHDDAIVDHAISFIRANEIPDGSFEFQMLYGVRPSLQRRVRAMGFPVRIAVPFGAEWFPYFMRRLAERPANTFFFLQSMWRG